MICTLPIVIEGLLYSEKKEKKRGGRAITYQMRFKENNIMLINQVKWGFLKDKNHPDIESYRHQKVTSPIKALQGSKQKKSS